jgi:hypothetical protein
VDRELSNCGHPFKIDRAQIVVRRVSPDGIVEAFDEIKHIRARCVTRSVVRPMGAFRLQRGEETLGDGVVPHVSRTTHTAGDADIA